MGIAGFWNDMNEPSIFNTPTSTMPEDVVHRIDEPGFTTRTAPHAELHNVYGLENSRATFDGLKKINPSLRPFVLTRATFAGGQRYAATWTGDNSSTWNVPEGARACSKGWRSTATDFGSMEGAPLHRRLKQVVLL
jgi:alpha-glucosidase